MSLLLLFGGSAVATTTFAGWSTVVCTDSDSWSALLCARKDTWGEWSSSTWNQIYDSPLTSNQSWGYMMGYTFVPITTASTTWVTT